MIPLFHIALYEPEIPQNAGNIGRLCLAVSARLHLIHPLGFQTDEKAVRRAGLDYWKHVDVQEHTSGAAFLEWAADKRIFLFSSRPGPSFLRVDWKEGDVVVFGRESKGIPKDLLNRYGSYHLPMIGNTRSINVANAASVVAYSVLAHIKPELF
jgi:tRNA (cytidine/uridine-2'-O-)-methyltransferase